MDDGQDTKPMGIRMPNELRQRLKKVAAKNHRTLSSEIVYRLEQSLIVEEVKTGEKQP